jgi:hypothetical protein
LTTFAPTTSEAFRQQAGAIVFCSRSVETTRTLTAGTATVTAYGDTNEPVSCDVTARIAVVRAAGGEVVLATNAFVIDNGTNEVVLESSIAETVINPGDRINLRFSFANETACDEVVFQYGAPNDVGTLELPPLE